MLTNSSYKKDINNCVYICQSLIDLIPDFIPIIGYLDDIILLPLGIALAVRLIPKLIWNECKDKGMEVTFKSLPHSKIAAFFVISIWILSAIMLFWTIN